MKPAAPQARIAAFWLDLLILLTCFAVLANAAWAFAPGTEVRESLMQFYTEKQFNAFWLNAFGSLLLVLSYLVLIPPMNGGATLGQRLMRIRMVALADGAPLTRSKRMELTCFSGVKLAFIVVGGPLAAMFHGNTALSLIALIAPTLALVLLSALSWASPDGIGPLERAYKYRFVATE